jgi:hypothetical protein
VSGSRAVAGPGTPRVCRAAHSGDPLIVGTENHRRRSGRRRPITARLRDERQLAADGPHYRICLVATATVLELPPMVSAHAPTSCLCIGCDGFGERRCCWSSRAGVWAPRCGRSRRTIRRDPCGQASSARWSVSSRHTRTVAGLVVAVDRRPPRGFGQRQDRIAHALVDRVAEGEPDGGFAARVGQRVAGAGRVRAREDRPIQRLAGGAARAPTRTGPGGRRRCWRRRCLAAG